MLLLLVSLDLHAEHFSSFATHHLTDHTADWRGKPDFGILLVDKQRIPGLDMVTLLDNHFRSDSLEVVGYQRILSLRLQLNQFLLSLALKVNVQAFT